MEYKDLRSRLKNMLHWRVCCTRKDLWSYWMKKSSPSINLQELSTLSLYAKLWHVFSPTSLASHFCIEAVFWCVDNTWFSSRIINFIMFCIFELFFLRSPDEGYLGRIVAWWRVCDRYRTQLYHEFDTSKEHWPHTEPNFTKNLHYWIWPGAALLDLKSKSTNKTWIGMFFPIPSIFFT